MSAWPPSLVNQSVHPAKCRANRFWDRKSRDGSSKGMVRGEGSTLEGSLGAGVPLSPSNPHVEDKMILSFRFPVFVTQSPTRQFSLSSRNARPVLGEDQAVLDTILLILFVVILHAHNPFV